MKLNFKISVLILLHSICLYAFPAKAANGIMVDVESVFVPVGKSSTTDTRSFTMLYGIKGFSELNENWRLSYGISTTYYSGLLMSFPVSIAFVPTGDYKINLRPQIFAGIEPFYSTIKDFSGLKWYGHFGLALDYVFDNSWIITVGSKVYINDSFFRSDSTSTGFNTGVLSVFAGAGKKL